MKLFENVSKSGEKTEELKLEQQIKEDELEAASIRAQIEKERQESIEKRLDELILVGKAVYTILKQEREDRQAAYERMENQIQKAAGEIISNQEKAVKVLLKYNQDDRQNLTSAISEEVVKVQKVIAVGQKHLVSAAEELNNTILNNTNVLEGKLNDLENSIKNMNISMAAAPTVAVEPVVAAPVVEGPVAEAPVAALPTEEMIDDIIAGLDMEEPVEDIVIGIAEEITEEVTEQEEPAPAPVMDDPNRAMTPDEIAALIASMN